MDKDERKNTIFLLHEEARNKMNNQIQIWNNHNAKAGLLLAVLSIILVFQGKPYPIALNIIWCTASIASAILIFIGMQFRKINIPPNLITLTKKYSNKNAEDIRLALLKNYTHSELELQSTLEQKSFCLHYASCIIFVMLFLKIINLFLT